MKTRYSFGGDEHIFVEVDKEMSLEAFFKSLAMTNQIKEKNIDGIIEVCPANASFQIKYDPDKIHPNDMMDTLVGIENDVDHIENVLETRIIEIPVYYNDPWTHETLMRFRERHQDPDGTDLEYGARINNFDSVDDFINAHQETPWIVTMVGFVAGLPFMYQLVDREHQIEVPKYLRPRTDTPKHTVGHGGCFSCIYSVRGAGGYQMFGVTPMPIFDPNQEVNHLKDFMLFFKPGDIVKYRSVDRDEYDQILLDVEEGTFEPLTKPVTFVLDDFNNDMEGYNKVIKEALYVN
ncbi:allophanate hydrolase subunit 1 [Cocleimonas sp. KMM 6892]|uniref:5-oxoprolinase subunit B family protein n=1 Tax=unclassified Cocleimonas TaxID=2639732 RepID=UPI002DBD36D0|nr:MULTISPECIES: allophanate hydrolase subunit 1 [unclassified Cocleimonas]MEB8433356.1 allophanate hydrolase subunit 1 [Cocleimonas sp. KMM 6892]MEC4716167.1 allophanate hydrolase subunit 1 [Cocleimonas sp. KMM 6895]MEC4745940.1 allophanate hydrolase subunit 1 [Cocleimonas sp. KMM 6896]